MPIRLLVTCEKQQELLDLEKAIVELRKVDKDIVIYLVNLTNFTGEILTPTCELFDKINTPSSLFNKAYYKLGLLKKVITILYGIGVLTFYSKKHSITHVLYGVPIVFFRGLNFIPLHKYITFSYVRSVVTSDDLKRKKLPNFVRKSLNKLRLTKPYVADHFFCIDDSTKEYISGFYPCNEGSQVLNIGSIYSYNLSMSRILLRDKYQEYTQEATNICFLSSAFTWHGDLDAGEAQVCLLEELIKKIQQFNLNTSGDLRLFLKLHPRDSIESYHHLLDRGMVEIMNELELDVLDDSYCFLSVLSTLSCELEMAGYKSLYICNSFLRSKYTKWYEDNKVIPFDVLATDLITEIVHAPAARSLSTDGGEPSPQKLLADYLIESTAK